MREEAYKAAQNNIRETKYAVVLEAETTFDNCYYHSAVKVERSLKIQFNNRILEEKRKKDEAKQAQYYDRQERQYQSQKFGRPDIDSSVQSSESKNSPSRSRSRGMVM